MTVDPRTWPCRPPLFPHRSRLLSALAILLAGCGLVTGGPDEVPEEQRFSLACPKQREAKVDTSFTPLRWGGAEDLREHGDTVAWAEVEEEVEEDEDYDEDDEETSVLAGIVDALIGNPVGEALGFRKDTMAMILVPGGVDVLRRDLATRLARQGYRLADLPMVGEDPAILRAELRRVEVVVKHGKPFGKDEVLASVVVELAADDIDGLKHWQIRLEAENLERRHWQSDAEDYQEVIGAVWCDLLDQAERGFREDLFRWVAAAGQ